MNTVNALLAELRAINETAGFNRWCGIEVESAEPGKVEISMPWRQEVGQYAGFLHAGLVGALIDTACGFAAVTLVGRVLASHYSVNCLRPAVGERFVARARVVKPGKSQVFTACELYAQSAGQEKRRGDGRDAAHGDEGRRNCLSFGRVERRISNDRTTTSIPMITSARHLAFHGTVVLLFGVLLGAPYARAIHRPAPAHIVNAWRVAHQSLPIAGGLMLSVAALLSSFSVGLAASWFIAGTLIASSYAFCVSLPLAAITGQRGLSRDGISGLGWLVLAANLAGAWLSVASCLGLVHAAAASL